MGACEPAAERGIARRSGHVPHLPSRRERAPPADPLERFEELLRARLVEGAVEVEHFVDRLLSLLVEIEERPHFVAPAARDAVAEGPDCPVAHRGGVGLLLRAAGDADLLDE